MAFPFHPRSGAGMRGLCGLWPSGWLQRGYGHPLGQPSTWPGWRKSVLSSCSQQACWAAFLPCTLSIHGMAINYAQRVHFQFKCVLIPEEQLMASSY